MRHFSNASFRYLLMVVCSAAGILYYASYSSLQFRKREPAQKMDTASDKLTVKELVLRSLIEHTESHKQEWIKLQQRVQNLTVLVNELKYLSHNSIYLPSAITDIASKSFNFILASMMSKMKERTPVTPVPVAPRHKVNIDGFNDLLLPRICGHSKPHFIAFVSSAPRNAAQRKALRETWANKSAYPAGFLEVMFVVGRAPSENDTLRRQLLFEWQTHGDLLYTDFIDSYGNLTYKTLVAFRFVVEHCAGTPYVIKADDDTVVNVPALHAHMLRYRPSDMVLDGNLHVNAQPRRDKCKWRVTYEEVPPQNPDRYPSFCSGGGVASTYVTIKAMYSHVAEVPWLRLEDVYSGYLAQKIKPRVQFHHVSYRLGYKAVSQMLQRPGPSPLLFLLEVEEVEQTVQIWGLIAKLNLKTGYYISKLNSSSSLDFRNPKLFHPA